ncbi:MAG: ferritin [Candidatus Kapabacteria bacterium]|nr:ferritin [Candidatus Kapabacteria bacterium]
MIKTTVQEAINQQIVREMFSSNLYLSMSAYFHSINLPGFANWMHVQAQEETTHAIKFFDYLLARGGIVTLGVIDAPELSWESPLAAFEAAYEHEQKVTSWINEIADLAFAEKDHPTNVLIQWFINEQVEEESNASDIVARMRLAGHDRSSMFFLDNELKQRKFVPPATGATT